MFRLLSRPFVFPFVRLGWRLGNVVIGRLGNKMVVVAERQQPNEASSGARISPVSQPLQPVDLARRLGPAASSARRHGGPARR